MGSGFGVEAFVLWGVVGGLGIVGFETFGALALDRGFQGLRGLGIQGFTDLGVQGSCGAFGFRG